MLDTEKTVHNALNPFQSQSIKELAAVTGMKIGTLNGIVTRLIDMGLAKVGSETRERNARTYLKTAATQPAPVQIAASMERKRRTVKLADLEHMRQVFEENATEWQGQINELTQWKEWAIGIHPDLGADPIVVKARQLYAAKIPASQMKNDILSGQLDDEPGLAVLIEILKEAA